MPSSISQYDYAGEVENLKDLLTMSLQKQLFFIGGSAKSGTTWVQLLLHSHPEIACSGETHFADVLCPKMAEFLRDQNQRLNWLGSEVFGEIEQKAMIDETALVDILRTMLLLMLRPFIQANPARVIGEKTPDNVLHFPSLNRLFPTAKFIRVVRDGRDCAVSAWFHNLRSAGANKDGFTEFVTTVAKRWVADLERGEAFAELVPERCHMLRYEDLITSGPSTLESLFRFLEVDASDHIVEGCLSGAAFETLSGGRKRGQENPSSFFRKGTIGDWKNHFDKTSEKAFVEIAGSWLARLGYG